MLLALPALESYRGDWQLQAAKLVNTPPKRLAYMAIGWGVTHETWFPKKSEVGAFEKLPEGLQPLNKHKKTLRSFVTVLITLAMRHIGVVHFG